MEKIKCEICGSSFDKYTTLGQHISLAHKISTKEYFDTYLSVNGDGICPICGKNTTYVNLSTGYRKCCSSTCSSRLKHEVIIKDINIEEFIEFYSNHSDKDSETKYCIEHSTLLYLLGKHNITKHNRSENSKLSSYERYGVEHPSMSNVVMDRIESTKLNRYGDKYYNNSEKNKKTCLDRYGVENIFQIDSCIKKSKITKLQKYNDENYNNQEKIHETKLNRYGDENYNNRAQARLTTKEKYGVEVYGGSNEQLEKALKTRISNHGSVKQSYVESHYKSKQTKLERYGDENYTNIEQCRKTKLERYGDEYYTNVEKRIKTNIERYGTTYAKLSDESKESSKSRMIETNLARYSVPYTCLIINSPKKKYSAPNQQFVELLSERGIIIDDSANREFTIGKYSYDFNIGGTLIEINPSATHNSTWSPYGAHKGIDKLYHMDKTVNANVNGYRCINVWDWDDMNKIADLLITNEKIYARKCSTQIVDKDEETLFINRVHLQNHIKSDIAVGLYYNEELVSIMTFGKPRYNKNYQYELLRYCSSKSVVGGAEKLLTYFIKNYNPQSIISYCDLSKFTGKLYRTLGFTLKNKPKPSKHWYNIKTKQHITDNLLRQRGFDQLLGEEYGRFGKGSSNEELMLQHRFVEIYDCGQATYIWDKDNQNGKD